MYHGVPAGGCLLNERSTYFSSSCSTRVSQTGRLLVITSFAPVGRACLPRGCGSDAAQWHWTIARAAYATRLCV